MTKEEYKIKAQELINNFETQKSLLAKEYAFANNSIKVGDIIKDHISSIKVEQIKYERASFLNEYPQCIYVGIELKKDLTPTKKETKRNKKTRISEQFKQVGTMNDAERL